ncbi:hypothetical protein BSL78_27050 [Apostichopus japonicus]|uniref:Uncharacterized protein n=1 Tax=Stichopus japonicus TaxID=307972 RepID=A0A2G8JK72_STIJA|nr:hypothetical protein BSL78_27050 [Apostichopus japonicus]
MHSLLYRTVSWINTSGRKDADVWEKKQDGLSYEELPQLKSTLGNIQTPTTEAATSLAAHDQRKATMISSSEESVLIDQQTIVDPTD